MGAYGATVELLGGMAFRAVSGSGHELILDSSPDLGGVGRGPTPMDLILLGLGGCVGMTVIGILRKMRQDVTSYQIRLDGEAATEHPKVFTTITLDHVVRGRELHPDLVRRAIERSATRYCPASAMLRQVASIDEHYRIVDEVTGSEVTGALTL